MTTKTKAKCSIDRDAFISHAQPMTVALGGTQVGLALPKEFSTGSFGWNHTGKMQLVVNGKAVEVQVGLNLTVIGSKEAS